MSTIEQQYLAIEKSPVDLEFLRSVETYNLDNCAWFHKKSDPNWELSNMSGAMPIRLKSGLGTWGCSEQLYQACKYQIDVEAVPQNREGDSTYERNVRKRIAAQNAARGAKMTQKCAVTQGKVRQDWDDPEIEIRIHAMLWVLENKLFKNRATFGSTLRRTGQKIIVEVSNKDEFWGCKVDSDSGLLVGSNVLGKLLTHLRDNNFKTVLGGEFTYPYGFLLD